MKPLLILSFCVTLLVCSCFAQKSKEDIEKLFQKILEKDVTKNNLKEEDLKKLVQELVPEDLKISLKKAIRQAKPGLSEDELMKQLGQLEGAVVLQSVVLPMVLAEVKRTLGVDTPFAQLNQTDIEDIVAKLDGLDDEAVKAEVKKIMKAVKTNPALPHLAEEFKKNLTEGVNKLERNEEIERLVQQLEPEKIKEALEEFNATAKDLAQEFFKELHKDDQFNSIVHQLKEELSADDIDQVLEKMQDEKVRSSMRTVLKSLNPTGVEIELRSSDVLYQNEQFSYSIQEIANVRKGGIDKKNLKFKSIRRLEFLGGNSDPDFHGSNRDQKHKKRDQPPRVRVTDQQIMGETGDATGNFRYEVLLEYTPRIGEAQLIHSNFSIEVAEGSRSGTGGHDPRGRGRTMALLFLVAILGLAVAFCYYLMKCMRGRKGGPRNYEVYEEEEMESRGNH